MTLGEESALKLSSSVYSGDGSTAFCLVDFLDEHTCPI
jgi:hypothetical protein